MTIIETERLLLRHLSTEDADFLVVLLNEPSFLANIGDRQVRSVEDARAYVKKGPAAMYEQHGVGLLLVELRDTREPIGMCGLLKRDGIDDYDIGYAFLPKHWGRGYAMEAARAVKLWGIECLDLRRLLAFVAPHNDSSVRLLEKLGFRYDKTVPFPTPDDVSKLYVWTE